MHTISDKKLLMLKPESIIISNDNARKNFDEYELKLLAESIHTSGIIQPITVRKNTDGNYELITGERRLKAATEAGLRRVPCILHKTDKNTARLYSIIDNVHRRNLTLFEEAEGIEYLIEKCKIPKTEVAARLGLSQSAVSNKLSILKLSEEIRERITAASLTERYIRALLRLPEEKQTEALDRIIAEALTLKQTEELISEMLEEKPEGTEALPEEVPEVIEKPLRKSAIGDMRLFSNSLSKLIDTLKNAGISAHSRKTETDKYIEYRVRIKKEPFSEEKATQLKIC